MKLANVKGVSAAVASLALVGTCFAAPAMADSASVFASSADASTDAAATDATAEVSETADASEAGTATLDASTQQTLRELLAALGIDDASIDQIVSADYAQLIADADAQEVAGTVTQAAQDYADELGVSAESLDAAADELAQAVSNGLADLGIDDATLDAAADELADAVSSAVGEFVGHVGTYLHDNGYLTDEYIAFSGDSTLSTDEVTQSVEYAGISFLLPDDYTATTMTADEMQEVMSSVTQQAKPEASLGDIVEDGFVGVSSDSKAAVFATKVKAEQFEDFNLLNFASVAYGLPYFSYSDEDGTFGCGGARLDDGTPIILTQVGSAQEGTYNIVFAPTAEGDSLVMFMAYAEADATAEDLDQVTQILASLTGYGPVQTSGTMTIDGDATAEEVVEAAVEAATGETAEAAPAEGTETAEAAPAEEAK